MSQYNAHQDIRRVRRWYSGTLPLLDGEPLTYDPTAAIGTDYDSRGRTVVKNGNALMFAGFVPGDQVDKVGPCFVELLLPGPGDVVIGRVQGFAVGGTPVGTVVRVDPAGGRLASEDDLGPAVPGEATFIVLEAVAEGARTAVLVQRV
jgi:hypothetical protein